MCFTNRRLPQKLQFGDLMGTIGQLFPLTDKTDGAAVEQVQQQQHFISKLYRFTLGLNHAIK
jgi:hypothetical protein